MALTSVSFTMNPRYCANVESISKYLSFENPGGTLSTGRAFGERVVRNDVPVPSNNFTATITSPSYIHKVTGRKAHGSVFRTERSRSSLPALTSVAHSLLFHAFTPCRKQSLCVAVNSFSTYSVITSDLVPSEEWNDYTV